MSAFPFPSVPLDIVEIIMENLADMNDMASLKACSLACHSFVPLCRKHIFSKIELDSAAQRRSGESQVRSFDCLLKRNSSIVKYIRHLDYTNTFNSRQAVPPVLKRLRRVTSFSLSFRDSGHSMLGEIYEWSRMPHYLKWSLATFIQSNQITELNLFGAQDIPVVLFTYFPHLSKLLLNCVTVANISLHGPFFKPRRSPKLVSLLVRNSNVKPMIKHLDSTAPGAKPILNLTGLEDFSLAVDGNPAAMDLLRSILKVSESLRTLTFSGSQNEVKLFETFANNLNPSSLKTLKTVKLLPMLETKEENPYLNFIPELQQISGKNVMEELLIRITIETDRRCTTDASVWAQLDHILSQPGDFPFLRHVDIKVIISHCSRDCTEFRSQLEEIGRSCFPWLKDNKVVKFSFEVTVDDV